MTNQTQDIDTQMSDVRIKLLDPLGHGIEGLKYQIKKGAQIIAKGVSDSQGRIKPFTSPINVPLTLYVKRFSSDEMKMIKTFIPWSEVFPVKLLSSKVKELMELVEDEGAPGQYRRKTYVVKSGDTLESVANANGTSIGALAALNGITTDSTLSAGQIIKLPPIDGATSAGGGSEQTNNASKGDDAPPAQAEAGTLDAGNGEATSAESDGTDSGGAVDASPGTPPTQGDKPNTAPATKTKSEDRGENGSPKTTLELTCEQKACIKLGDKGLIVEEINIRLMGFGGTVAAPAPLNEFTTQTEKAVKQFQRDYMQVAETGKVCGSVLRALDDFMKKYPVSLADMKCHCGKCDGFGHGYQDSGAVDLYKPEKKAAKGSIPVPDAKPVKKPYPGIERPGMHRSIFWALRAALYYVGDKDKELCFKFLKISSGYRCWEDNKKHHRTTHNHMGDALDIQFAKDDAKIRCEGADLEKLRKKIFHDRLGGQMGWGNPAKCPEDIRLSLERKEDGATSWIHADVRNFLPAYKDPRYYAVKQSYADGDPMIEMAKREGRLSLLTCGGIPPKAPPPESADRIPIATLKISRAGVDFIKGWEKCALKPYLDSEGYCTIGWGHLIDDHRSCDELEKAKSSKYAQYKDGINQEEADRLLEQDIARKTEILNERVQVPMYQHEYDALASLIFNLGGFKKCPKLLAKLNTKDYSGCCDEFADITNGGVKGLIDRRKAEMKMFRSNVYDSTH